MTAPAERTGLAWERTALGLAGTAALLLHGFADRPGWRVALAGPVLLAAFVLAVVVGPWRHRVARDSQGVLPVPVAVLAALTVCLPAIGVLLLVLVG